MVPDGTAAELHAVAHQIVLVGGDGQGIDLAPLGLQQHLQPAAGHGEGVVAELQLTAFVADLVHGEVHDPAELVALLIHMTGAGGAEGLDEHTCGFGGRCTGGHHHQRIGCQRQHLFQLGPQVGDELGDTAGQLTLFVHLEPVGLAAGLHLAVGQELLHLLACQGAVRDIHHFHGLAPQGLELAVFKESADILAGQVDAQIRLVGAVGLQRRVVGDAAEGSRRGDVIGAELGEDGRQHVLQHGEHVLLRGEGHLHIQLVELAGRAVATGVLVPEAGGDLEVPVEAGGHQQLLELLGGLWQGIELAGMLPGRHQIVPCALRGGGRQDGSGDLQEAVLRHGGPQSGHHLAAQDDVVLHGGVPQVQIPVLQALGLVGLPAAVDLKGQAVVAAAAQHLDLAGDHLNVAGGQLGVFAGPLPDDALHADGGLLVQVPDDGHHLLGLDDHLRGAVEIPQHHKGKVTAHLPDIFHPTYDLHGLPGIGQPQLPAGMGTHLHHSFHSCF